MEKGAFQKIERLLISDKPGELRVGLQLVKEEISRVGSEDAKPLLEMVSSVFYIDPLARPGLVPLLDEAITLIVGFGGWVIPILIKQLEVGDYKAQIAIAHALGRIGADAIAPLMKEYESTADVARRSFILYALGKIKSPKIVQALQVILEAAGSEEGELRDTGTRAIGKCAESIPAAQLQPDMLQSLLKQLQTNLSDENSAIRAKAVRSLGKLAKHGHLNAEEKKKLKATFVHIVGKDEHFDWDRAYLVRKEAEEALRYV